MLVGFLVTLVLIILNFFIARRIMNIFGKILEFKDKRIGLTKDVLSAMKEIRMLNWQGIMYRKLMALRSHELRQVSYEKYLDAFCVFFWEITSLVISGVTFALYYKNNFSFENINVFTAIYLFELLIGPLNALPWTVSGIYNS